MLYVLHSVVVCFFESVHEDLCDICSGVQWIPVCYAVSAVFRRSRIVHANAVSAVVDISMHSTAVLLSAISAACCLHPIVCVVAAETAGSASCHCES
jgi:hypothetical protein